MFANVLISEFTRFREGNNQSTYRNLSLAPNIREEVRFAHSPAGKLPDGNALARHLVGYEVEIAPTATNGLLKAERLTINLTITQTPGIPLTAGTGDFAHAYVSHGLLQVVKLAANNTVTDANAGAIGLVSLINGEV